MLASNETALRSFCARMLGWTTDREVVVEQALRSIELAADQSAALVVLSDGYSVPLALALHRRTRGAEQPFIVADRQRRNTSASVRTPKNLGLGSNAFAEAAGGSLCVRYGRLPPDFSSVVAMMRDLNASVQLIVCADAHFDTHPFLVLPAPIRVPPLTTRTKELPRIVDEYAADAIAELGAHAAHFTEDDKAWVLAHRALTLEEIEKATLRLVALKMSKTLPHAAERLGMAPVSLSRWIGRRKLPRVASGKRVTRAAR